MDDEGARRPLKVRDAGPMQSFARWLSKRNITPNQISVLSVVFALFAALCLLAINRSELLPAWAWLVLAAVSIQCRLLCNLFDGMVAVEGGKSTASGELFNDIPDRIADPLILVAAGYVIPSAEWGIAVSYIPPSFEWSVAAGWCAGLLAVMTAYVRVLAASIGAPVNFCGPMAKQHRMAIVTVACLVSTVETFWWNQGTVLLVALIVIVAGCVVTVARRSYAAYAYLEKNKGA